ncbi:MAG: replication initiation protein [Thermonemataceae bacterium]|nr:replication initiation protein [Thermonemataceae bacterium]
MSDKRKKTEILSPAIYSPEEIKAYAKQHWNFTFAKQKKISVYAKRIMANVLGMIHDEKELRPYYEMRATDIVVNEQDSSSIYKKIKNAIDELMEQIWRIENITTFQYEPYHLLDSTKRGNVFYNNGTLRISLNPALKDFFIELSHYTTYEIKWYMMLRSWYSMRMFEALSAFKDTGIWITSIAEYRKLMDCEKKYPEVKDLIKYTLTEPLAELEKTDVAFTYTPILDANHRGRGRKPIVALEFKLKKTTPKKIPQGWYQFSDEYKRILESLLSYGISEAHIIRYAPHIGIEGVKEIMKVFYKAQINVEIKDKKAYYNKIWLNKGEEAKNKVEK